MKDARKAWEPAATAYARSIILGGILCLRNIKELRLLISRRKVLIREKELALSLLVCSSTLKALYLAEIIREY